MRWQTGSRVGQERLRDVNGGENRVAKKKERSEREFTPSRARYAFLRVKDGQDEALLSGEQGGVSYGDRHRRRGRR